MGSPSSHSAPASPARASSAWLDASPFTACTSPEAPTRTRGRERIPFQVRARDAAGNADPAPAARTWRIDTLEPDTSITAKPRDPINSSDAVFAFSSSDAGVGFECSLDAGPFATCSSPKVYTGLAQARHTFRVRARDGSGNVDLTPATHALTVDVTSPDTSIVSAPPSPTNSRDASISIGANEPGVTLECKLDNDPFAGCSSPKVYSDLGEGTHTVQARATDAAGNLDPTPAIHSWTIDVTSPTTTIDTGPGGPTNNPNATFTFSSGDPTALFECQHDGSAFAPCVPDDVCRSDPRPAHVRRPSQRRSGQRRRNTGRNCLDSRHRAARRGD